jgi:hypothetical protein
MSFIRLGEEQFADNWFDVLLVRSPELKLDRLTDLENFGALVIDSYEYVDENAAFDRLRKFAQDHALICLSSYSALFKRIQSARVEFPLLEIIDRPSEEAGETIEALKPTYHYNQSSIRQQWHNIRAVLDRKKIPTNADSSSVTGELAKNYIKLNVNVNQQINGAPVLIANTFHPNWQRTDGKSVYAATPFYMLTFVDQSTSVVYGRRWFDRVSLWASVGSFLILCFLTGIVPGVGLLGKARRLQ